MKPLEGFDFFDDPDSDQSGSSNPPIPGLPEPEYVDASQYIKPEVQFLLEDPAIRIYRTREPGVFKKYGWEIRVDRDDDLLAAAVGKRIQNHLRGKRELDSSHYLLRYWPLFVRHNNGLVVLPPKDEPRAGYYEPYPASGTRRPNNPTQHKGHKEMNDKTRLALEKAKHKVAMNSLNRISRDIQEGVVYHGQMADGAWASVGPYIRAVGRKQYAVFLKHHRVESSDPSLVAAAFRAMVLPNTIRTSTDRDRLDNPSGRVGRKSNPTMDPKVAQAVITEAERSGIKSKISKDQAWGIIHAWLKARGLSEDRYGNFLHPSGDRYHFSRANLQRQAKWSGGWRNLTSTPFVDAATNLLSKAAETTGNAKWASLSGKRQEAKKKAASRADDQRMRARAGELAMKAIAQEDPKNIAANLRHETLPDADYERLSKRVKELTDTMYQLLKAGAQPPQDSQFASIDKPPVPAIYKAKVEYVWTETVDGVLYTIRVRNHEKGQAEVHIGKASGMGLSVNPYTMSMSYIDTTDAVGDAYVSGRVSWSAKLKSHVGAMFLIMATDKRKGAGSRVLDIWCRMMRGYGVKEWVAQAVGEEGFAFLKAKHKAGVIRLLAVDGSNLLVECAGR